MAAASSGLLSPQHSNLPSSPTLDERVKSVEAKVVILGCQGVGKTSLVIRNMGGGFKENVNPTIGASFFSFIVSLAGYRIKLQVWDTAGQERFRSMAPMYYRRANAAIVVYDITSEKSFDEATHWIKEVQNKVESSIAISVVGNKSDLEGQRMVSRDRGEYLAHSLGGMFTETSAINNTGVKEAFLKVAHGVIELYNEQKLKSSLTDSFSQFASTNSPMPPGNIGLSNGNGASNIYLYRTSSIDDADNSTDVDHNKNSQNEKSSFCC